MREKMEVRNRSSEELIAPCGMNCAVCSRYLSGLNNLKKSRCPGCRAKKEKCFYLFDKCRGINNDVITSDADFCFNCDQYPCRQIKRMDDRYRKNYGMSIKDNLHHIKTEGIETFIEGQYEKYRCTECGGLISIHNGKCFQCETITKLIVKS